MFLCPLRYRCYFSRLIFHMVYLFLAVDRNLAFETGTLQKLLVDPGAIVDMIIFSSVMHPAIVNLTFILPVLPSFFPFPVSPQFMLCFYHEKPGPCVIMCL